MLSSAGGAYLEAFSAFQASYGAPVRYFDASKGKTNLPPGTKLVVTFGTRAAAQGYPPGVDQIYCMAPGFFLAPGAHSGKAIKISMRVSPARMLSKLIEIQPSLKRLRILWMSPAYTSFFEAYGEAGRALGLEIAVVKVAGPDQLPALLRTAIGRTDAIWLPPDPLLVSSDSLMILRQFAWNNSIPLYGTTKGMSREGACASVGVSFAESGASAAAAVRSLQAGESLPKIIFPEVTELTLNASSAKRCGLRFSPEILREAAYLFP